MNSIETNDAAVEATREAFQAILDGMGPDQAIETFEAWQEALKADCERHARTPHGAAGNDLAAWVRRGRDIVTDADTVAEFLRYVEARKADPNSEAEVSGPIDPGIRDGTVLRLLVAEGHPGPDVVGRVLYLVGLGPGDDIRDLREIEGRLEQIRAALRGDIDLLTCLKLEAEYRELVPKRNKLARAADARAQADEAIREHLRDHAAEALGDLAPIISGLHSAAAINSPIEQRSDPQIAKLMNDLAVVQRTLDSLAFGGKLFQSVASDEATATKREIEKALAARRRELFAELGGPASTLAASAASGDPEALEQIAVQALASPSCFARDLVGRILDLQARALSEASTVALDSLLLG